MLENVLCTVRNGLCFGTSSMRAQLNEEMLSKESKTGDRRKQIMGIIVCEAPRWEGTITNMLSDVCSGD